MQIAILGYGEQGRSAYEYWRTGNNITVCDQNTDLELPVDVQKKLGPNHLNGLDVFDIIIRSPIVHPQQIVQANTPSTLQKVTTVTNEFFKVCPTKNIIGITGTKGKGTTSTLITKILEAVGHHVHLGGNIGTPPLDMLKNDIQPSDWVVLELANFQLIDLEYSPSTGVCLMVVPEHLNWHKDFEEYWHAKQQLFAHQTTNNSAIYYSQNEISKKIASVGNGKKIPYYEQPGAYIDNDSVVIDGQIICKTDEIKLLGKHNWQNVCASVTAVWQITQDISALRSVITTFKGMEYRLEFVREYNGINYYNDSFGTTPETAIVAIEAFRQPKVVILGGSDKGASYDMLAKTVLENNVRAVVLIGDTAPVIEQELRTAGYETIHQGGRTMPEMVALASSLAEPGDVVLLSTGCASFGLFQNYKDRGEQFKTAVLTLA